MEEIGLFVVPPSAAAHWCFSHSNPLKTLSQTALTSTGQAFLSPEKCLMDKNSLHFIVFNCHLGFCFEKVFSLPWRKLWGTLLHHTLILLLLRFLKGSGLREKGFEIDHVFTFCFHLKSGCFVVRTVNGPHRSLRPACLPPHTHIHTAAANWLHKRKETKI